MRFRETCPISIMWNFFEQCIYVVNTGYLVESISVLLRFMHSAMRSINCKWALTQLRSRINKSVIKVFLSIHMNVQIKCFFSLIAKGTLFYLCLRGTAQKIHSRRTSSFPGIISLVSLRVGIFMSLLCELVYISLDQCINFDECLGGPPFPRARLFTFNFLGHLDGRSGYKNCIMYGHKQMVPKNKLTSTRPHKLHYNFHYYECSQCGLVLYVKL